MVHGDGQMSDAELAAFADGSLPPRRRGQVAARIERSPELRALVGEQSASLDAVRALDAPAPARLRARIRPEPSRPPSRPRARLRPVPLAIASAMAVLRVVVLPPQGRRNEPTVLEVAQLAGRSPSAPAPPPDRAEPSLLNAAVAGVPLANYAAQLGWHAIGTRADEFAGRETRTVFYARGRRRIAYSIVARDALAWLANARRTLRDGAALRHLRRGRQMIVSWLRAGHTCVLSGVGLRSDELLELAAWNGSMDIARIHPGLLPPLAPAVHRPAP
jgi:anti-sigma factor RsiW